MEKKDSRVEGATSFESFQRFCGKDAIVSSLKRILESLRHCPVEVTDDLEMFSQEDMKRVACFENTPTNVQEFFTRVQVILDELRSYFYLDSGRFSLMYTPTLMAQSFLETSENPDAFF